MEEATNNMINNEGKLDTDNQHPLSNGLKLPNKTGMDDSFESNDDEDYNGDEDDNCDDSDREDNAAQNQSFPSPIIRRITNPILPNTVTTLQTNEGAKVYLVGTAHFSKESQDDVSKTIQLTQPDIVLVELCASRVGILQMDEEKLLEEAKNINIAKLRSLIRQTGMVQGLVHLLLLSMSAHLTEQLGMAPGGEFRRAFQEAQKIPGCRIHLGDRPVGITLRRAVNSLSFFQKMQLMWCLITCKDPISKEEVEKCKQKDLLEEMMREMAGEFPALSRVFVKERDLYLAHSLRAAASIVPVPEIPNGLSLPVVVGVVGIGHVQGIKDNWEKKINIKELLTVPEGKSKVGLVLKWSLRAALLGVVSWGCVKIYQKLPIAL